jgi:hypothetical protein
LKNSKKIMAVSMATAMTLSSMSTAFAFNMNGTETPGVQIGDKFYSMEYISTHGSDFADLFGNAAPENVVIDLNEKPIKYSDYVAANYPSDFDAWASDVNNQTAANPTVFVGADGTETPVGGELTVDSVSAITSTKLQVTLNKAVDAAAAANFTIAGATVNSATLDETKKVVTLGVTGLVASENYTLTVTGLQINAEVQPDMDKAFTMPEVSALFTPEISFEEGVDQLKADGASSTLVTYELKDAEGNVVTDAEDVEVAFTTTFGSFGENRVSVQNGVATVLLTSEFLTVDRTAQITAVIRNAADESLFGLEANSTILMTPNPDSGNNETVGASMTDAESNQSDRIIVYFNKDVDVNDYLSDTTGKIDGTKATVNVRTNSISDTTGSPMDIAGLLPVQGNDKALQILLDVENLNNGPDGMPGGGDDYINALTDNSDVWVQFIDSTKTVTVDRSLSFKNTDIRKPSMLNVTHEGLRKLVITFSEAVINDNSANGVKDLTNWSIDGTLLTNAQWGAVNVAAGSYDPATGEDKRHIVTIELGAGKYFASGNHSVQAANIGDWAMLSDNNNIMNTQTLDFAIPVDNDAPSATVEVQSPEQWLVTYDKDVNESAADFAQKIKLQRFNTTSSAWADDNVTSYNDEAVIGAKINDGNLDITVRKIDSNKFLIETDYDWSKVHDKEATGKNYFNYNYQLSIEADAVTNVANGKKNIAETLALGGAMTSVDAQSPVIDANIEQVDGTLGLAGVKVYEVTMSEPVKLNTTANEEGATLAQDQTTLPVPTAEFVKKDGSQTIAGKIDTSFVDDYETVIRAYAVDTDGTTPIDLSAGEWTLIIRSISDDYGNTAASESKDFTVEGSVIVEGDFDILWAFADVDKFWKVEDLDEDDDGGENGIQDGIVMDEDDDASYDYVVIKFNEAVATAGDFKNATKTSNYTFNGQPLPIGTQILANIEGYDDLDSTVDSVTIRLPQGTLQTDNAPHNVNISRNIESADGDKLAGNGGEITVAFDNYTWDTSMVADIDGDVATRVLVDAVQTARDAMDNGIDATEISGFETAFVAAQNSITLLPAESLVKDQYQAKIDELKAEVLALSDFATFMVPGNFDVTADTASTIDLVIDGAAPVTDFSVMMPGSTTVDRYTIADNGPVNGDTITVTAATGTVAVTGDTSAGGADGTFTITITDNFWDVSDTVTVDVTDDTNGSETFTINAD